MAWDWWYSIHMRLYHAGPKGLTELMPLRELINTGVYAISAVQSAWRRKWGDYIEEDALLAHPTMDEISFTTSRLEAEEIAERIDGQVYEVDIIPIAMNEEGYPVFKGRVSLA